MAIEDGIREIWAQELEKIGEPLMAFGVRKRVPSTEDEAGPITKSALAAMRRIAEQTELHHNHMKQQPPSKQVGTLESLTPRLAAYRTSLDATRWVYDADGLMFDICTMAHAFGWDCDDFIPKLHARFHSMHTAAIEVPEKKEQN